MKTNTVVSQLVMGVSADDVIALKNLHLSATDEVINITDKLISLSVEILPQPGLAIVA